MSAFEDGEVWEGISYDDRFCDSETSSQGETCPYCDILIHSEDLVEHLDRCDMYQEVAMVRSFNDFPHCASSPEPRSPSFGSDTSEEDMQASPPPRRKVRAVTSNSIGCCPICYHNYNSKSVLPLILPSCGHTCCQRCLVRMVDDQTGNLKCPVCRTNHFREVETLPVNYALLELAETHKPAVVCEKHGKELVGFCLQDSELICGICMFDHRDHEAFPINSAAAEAYVKSNAERLKENEKLLKEAEVGLMATHKRTVETQSQINELVNFHISGVKEAEEAIIKEVRAGSAACVAQLKSFVAKSNMDQIVSSVIERLSKVKAELKTLQEHKSNYSALSTLQKLQLLIGRPAISAPVQLGGLKTLRNGLAVEINYESAVRRAELPLE